MYIYIYVYVCMHACMYVYIYTYTRYFSRVLYFVEGKSEGFQTLNNVKTALACKNDLKCIYGLRVTNQYIISMSLCNK